MSSIKSNTIIDNHSLPLLITSDPDGGRHLINDNDEIKIFEWDKHEDNSDIDEYDNTNRLSPVIKDEESSLTNPSSINIHNNDQQEFHNFFPYFISPYYQTNNVIQSFDKISSLETLSKFMSPSSNSNLNIDQYTGISLPSPYSQHWRSSMFPLVLPSFSSNSSSSHSISHNPYEFEHQLQREVKQPKKSHIKKPLNAFMLFMKEQRTQVVQECTLRESAAINQILGRKWHELDRNVQQKYYDMARDERMKHTQLYPGWSARDNYGIKKKQINKGKKRDKNQECLNQKKCRARFGLEQQINWCKHCKRKKKCLRYTENETMSMHVSSWSDEDDTDNIDDSNDCDVIPIIEQNKNLLIHTGISMDSDEENKIRLLECQQISNLNQLNSIKMKTIKKDSSTSFHHYEYSSMPILNDLKREI